MERVRSICSDGLTYIVTRETLALFHSYTLPVPSQFLFACSSYGYFCRVISQYKQHDVAKISLGDMAIAGALTGLFQTPIRQVVERIKSVMQVRETTAGKQAYKWSGECFVELIRTEGVRKGLFQGMSPVLLREVPQFAVYYPCYEFTKGALSTHIVNPSILQFVSGGIAGVVQWLPPIYFADVLKSRMQTAPSGYYKGWIDCTQRLIREEGFRTFYRGLNPALLRAFPLHALIFVGYETTMTYLKDWRL